MENKSLIETNYAISIAFRQFVDAQTRLDESLAAVDGARDIINSRRIEATLTHVDALANPHGREESIMEVRSKVKNDTGDSRQNELEPTF